MNESKSQLKRRAIQRPDTVRCTNCNDGVMFDVTSALAQSMNIKQTRCDKCGASASFRVEVR